MTVAKLNTLYLANESSPEKPSHLQKAFLRENLLSHDIIIIVLNQRGSVKGYVATPSIIGGQPKVK